MDESDLDYMPDNIPLEELILMVRSGRVFYIKERGLITRALDNYIKVWFDAHGKVHSERFGKLGSMKMFNMVRTAEGVAIYLKKSARFGSVILMEKASSLDRNEAPK